MAVESINNNTKNNLVSKGAEILASQGKTDLNETKDKVSIGGNNAALPGSSTYDMQLNSLRSEIGELKQLANTLIAQEFLAKRGGALLNRPADNNTMTPIVNSNSGMRNPMMNAIMSGGVTPNVPVKKDESNPQDPVKPKTEEELIREAMQQQILAQMKIKRDMLAWDTTLMKEKFEYELALSWQQHQTKISEMVMAAFSKIRELNEQMWLSLRQKEDQLDSQRIKVLGGF